MPLLRHWGDEARIRVFWSWWATHRDEVVAAAVAERHEELATLVRPAVRRLGRDLSWGFGTGVGRPWQLIVSPGGMVNRLMFTVGWADAAPDDPDVEFKPARQAVDEVGTVTMPDGTVVDVDRTRYVVGEKHDGRVDVRVVHPDLPEPPTQTAYDIAFLALDASLGEMAVTMMVGAISTSNDVPEDAVDGARLRAAFDLE